MQFGGLCSSLVHAVHSGSLVHTVHRYIQFTVHWYKRSCSSLVMQFLEAGEYKVVWITNKRRIKGENCKYVLGDYIRVTYKHNVKVNCEPVNWTIYHLTVYVESTKLYEPVNHWTAELATWTSELLDYMNHWTAWTSELYEPVNCMNHWTAWTNELHEPVNCMNHWTVWTRWTANHLTLTGAIHVDS